MNPQAVALGPFTRLVADVAELTELEINQLIAGPERVTVVGCARGTSVMEGRHGDS